MVVRNLFSIVTSVGSYKDLRKHFTFQGFNEADWFWQRLCSGVRLRAEGRSAGQLWERRVVNQKGP
jgi:hypothetical protein